MPEENSGKYVPSLLIIYRTLLSSWYNLSSDVCLICKMILIFCFPYSEEDRCTSYFFFVLNYKIIKPYTYSQISLFGLHVSYLLYLSSAKLRCLALLYVFLRAGWTRIFLDIYLSSAKLLVVSLIFLTEILFLLINF